ncbi:periplasmic binding protein-like I [Phlyctochytrium arcticum]|nr:periplasmic binding protein-like I [Phlyctochytrium arcticum]
MILTRWNRPSMLGVAILYIVFGSLWSWGWAADVPVKIGIIMPYSLKVKRAVEVRAILPAVQLAMDEINNSSTLLPGIQLQAVTRDSWTVQYENTSLVDSAAQALAATTELITDEAVIAVIGDLQSPTTEYEGLLTSYHKIPQFGPATSSPTLSNRDRYPYLYRMTHDQEQPAIFLVDYIKQMGWKRVAVLKTTDAFGTAVAEAVLARCAHNSVTVILNQGFYQTGERDSITLNLALTNLANVGAQIVIVCANPYNTADIYYAAYDAGLVGREYVWLGASGIGEEGDDLIAEYGPDAIPKSQGFIAAWPEGGQESPTGKAWLAKWDDLNKNDSYRYPM